MLRQHQQQAPLPAPLADLLRRHDAAEAAAGAGGAGQVPAAAAAAAGAPAAAPGAGRPGRPFPNIIIRINMRAVLQLLVLMVVVYQHCPPGRFFMLLGLGLLLYLTATEPVRRFLNRLVGVQRAVPAGPPQPPQQPQQQQGQEAAGVAGEQPAAAAAGDAAQPQPDGAAPAAPPAGGVRALPAAGAEQRGGLLRELQALVLGFFTSLIPGAQTGCLFVLLEANGLPLLRLPTTH
jgi:hypothetical protein